MKKIFIIKIICLMITAFSLINTSSAYSTIKQQKISVDFNDFDPLVDIHVTVDILKIRSLEKFEYPNPKTYKKIDFFGEPDFFVKVYINEHEFTSPIWYDTKYIYDPQFSPTADVPDDVENVSIKIQLWDWNPNGNRLCDIGGYSKFDVSLIYNIKTGHWTGDDFIGDPSGYGRLNGCDDNSVYTPERDCELWFNIYQNDYDGDGIPYWTEVYVYGTDPTVNDIGRDDDNDGIPIEWEWKWGYNPFKKDSHNVLDPDNDGLNNYEEYLTSQWSSDPFRQDIFIELDQMSAGPNGEPASFLPDGSKELLYTAFNRYNKVLHIDDGCMGGGEIIPFDEKTVHEKLENVYWSYFLHGNENNWRRYVFRYGLVVYDPGGPGYNFWNGAYVIGTKYVDKKVFPKTQKIREITYASVYMHECGHTLSLHNPGVDNQNSKFPWQVDFWKYGPYKSCMNYRYTYRLVDYSDGSRSINDFNDWEDMDLTRFQKPWA